MVGWMEGNTIRFKDGLQQYVNSNMPMYFHFNNFIGLFIFNPYSHTKKLRASFTVKTILFKELTGNTHK